jgi:Lrp/AsnC family transcriptional regulator for asnA, asnC and gidA
MDELDRKIIGILQQDGRASNAKIARQLGVSEGTIRRRLKRLIEDEVIQVLALPEPSKLGYTTEAIIALQVDPGRIEDVAIALAKAPEALNVSITTGAFDLFAYVALPSPEELHRFILGTIGNIPGVRHSETFVTMSVKKRTLAPLY